MECMWVGKGLGLWSFSSCINGTSIIAAVCLERSYKCKRNSYNISVDGRLVSVGFFTMLSSSARQVQFSWHLSLRLPPGGPLLREL